MEGSQKSRRSKLDGFNSMRCSWKKESLTQPPEARHLTTQRLWPD